MFMHDTEAKRRVNAAQLYAVGFAFSSRDLDGKLRTFQVDGCRWFLMAKSPRLAIREVLGQHAGEIATRSSNAVKETVFTTNGFPCSGLNAEDLGVRVLYVCPAEDLPNLTIAWDPFNPGKILGEDTYSLLLSLPGEKYNGTEAKEITFRFVRAR